MFSDQFENFSVSAIGGEIKSSRRAPTLKLQIKSRFLPYKLAAMSHVTKW